MNNVNQAILDSMYAEYDEYVLGQAWEDVCQAKADAMLEAIELYKETGIL